jgi:hypothetical protein
LRETEKFANCADLVGGKKTMLLAIYGNRVFIKAFCVLEPENELSTLRAAQVSGRWNGDFFTVDRQAQGTALLDHFGPASGTGVVGKGAGAAGR